MWAYLRTEVGAFDGAPRLLDPQGVTWEDWQARNPVAGGIEVRPADDGGAPHQRMVFYTDDGQLHREIVPLRDREGQLVGYADVDHDSGEGKPLVSGRLDVNGNVEQGHPLTVTGQPGGGLVVEDGTGQVLFRRFAWGTAPGTNQSTPQTEPPRGTIARPFLADSHGDIRQVRPGEAVLGRGAREPRIHAPWEGPGLQLRDGQGRRVPGQFVRDGDRFVFLRPLSADSPYGPKREYRLDARWRVESESLILGGPYADPRIAGLRVALQERPGGGTERVLVGPEEHREAFRLETWAGGGYDALVETATGIRHLYGRRGKALYREVPVGSSRHYVRIPTQNPDNLRVVRATDPVNAPSRAAFGPVQRRGEHEVVVSPVGAEAALATPEGGLPMPRVVVDTRDGRILEEVLRAEGEGPAAYWKVDHLTRQAVPLDAAGQEVVGEGGASLRPVLERGADSPGLRFLDGDGNVVLDRTGPNPLDEWAPAAGSDDSVSEHGSLADLLGFEPQEVALVEGGVQVGRSYYAHENASPSSLPLHARAADYVERLARTEDGRPDKTGLSRVPWPQGKESPIPYFVELGGDDQHFRIRDEAGEEHEFGLDEVEKVAEAIGADPQLRRRTGQGAPVVLLLPHGAMGGLELPRALSDRTRATVWAATSDVRLVPGRNNGHRITLMTQELPGTDRNLPGQWLRTEPGDAGPGGVRAGERSGEPGYLQLPDGSRVQDTEVRSQPVIDRRDHRPRGRSTLKADDRVQLYAPFLPALSSYANYRFLRRLGTRYPFLRHLPLFRVSFGSKPLPHLNHGADAYHVDGHGKAGAVKVALRDGEPVLVTGEEWGRYLMRRPSFRRLPPTSPVVMWNCSAAAPPHRRLRERYPELTSAAEGLAIATGRIVYGADGVVYTGFDYGGQVYTEVGGSVWGQWRQVRPEARTEELERSAFRNWPLIWEAPPQADVSRRPSAPARWVSDAVSRWSDRTTTGAAALSRHDESTTRHTRSGEETSGSRPVTDLTAEPATDLTAERADDGAAEPTDDGAVAEQAEAPRSPDEQRERGPDSVHWHAFRNGHPVALHAASGRTWTSDALGRWGIRTEEQPLSPGTAEEAGPGADRPAIRPVLYGGAIDRVLYGDAIGADVVESERLIAEARAEAGSARAEAGSARAEAGSARAEADSGEARAESRDVPLNTLHQGSMALRSAAYDRLLRDAQQALRSHLAQLEDRPAELSAGFTVTALPGGGHAVVHHGPGNESADGPGNVLGGGPGLRIEFDARQRWTSREYLLGEPPRTMAGLRAVADRTWGPGDEENGAGRITYRLTGNSAGAVARFAVHTVPPESAEYVHGPFVATDGG